MCSLFSIKNCSKKQNISIALSMGTLHTPPKSQKLPQLLLKSNSQNKCSRRSKATFLSGKKLSICTENWIFRSEQQPCSKMSLKICSLDRCTLQGQLCCQNIEN